MPNKEQVLAALVEFRNGILDLTRQVHEGSVDRDGILHRLDQALSACHELTKAVELMNEPSELS